MFLNITFKTLLIKIEAFLYKKQFNYPNTFQFLIYKMNFGIFIYDDLKPNLS